MTAALVNLFVIDSDVVQATEIVGATDTFVHARRFAAAAIVVSGNEAAVTNIAGIGRDANGAMLVFDCTGFTALPDGVSFPNGMPVYAERLCIDTAAANHFAQGVPLTAIGAVAASANVAPAARILDNDDVRVTSDGDTRVVT